MSDIGEESPPEAEQIVVAVLPVAVAVAVAVAVPVPVPVVNEEGTAAIERT